MRGIRPKTGPLVKVASTLPASALALLVLMRDEADGPLGRLGRRHQLAQRVEHLLELVARVAAEGVVVLGQRLGLVFEFGQALGQVASADQRHCGAGRLRSRNQLVGCATNRPGPSGRAWQGLRLLQRRLPGAS